MSPNEWRKSIKKGTPLFIDGGSHIVEDIFGGWVTLRAMDGGVRRLPLFELVNHVAKNDSPPPFFVRLEDIHSRLSEKQHAKSGDKKRILRWVETGLRPEQNDGEIPDARYDPKLITKRSHRVNAIAEVIARERGIQFESAVKYVNRTLDRGTLGEAGLVDSRYVAALPRSQRDSLEGRVRDFLLDGEFRSTTTNMSKYHSFAAWLKVEFDEDPPSDRTFRRILTNIYQRYPHLRQKAKTRASVAQAPKVAVQRRFPMRVGEYWFIDATPSNVMIRDPYAPEGTTRNYRLSFTKIMDGATRFIVGSSISEEVNGYAAGLALADAFKRMHEEPDKDLVSEIGHQWPTVGLPRVLSRWPVPPRRLLLDNGREFLNKHILWTLHRLGIDAEPQRVRDGRAKAPLERHFGTNRTIFEEQQYNYISGSVEGRGSAADKEVILTWEHLMARDRAWTDLYNVTEHRGLAAATGRRISPAQRWIELADEHGAIEVVAWRNEWIKFLPHQKLNLSRYGVTRRGLVYNAPIIQTLIDVDGAAPDGMVLVFWDPADLRQIYCFDPEGNAYEIPWVYRTEDVVSFSDFVLDWANKRLEGSTFSKKNHQNHLIDLVMHWMQEDIVLLAGLQGKQNAQEILGSQLEALKRNDKGSVNFAKGFTGQEMVDSYGVNQGDSGFGTDFDDGGIGLLGNDDDDLFSVFNS